MSNLAIFSVGAACPKFADIAALHLGGRHG